LQREGGGESASPPLTVAAGSYTAIRLVAPNGDFGGAPPTVSLRFAPREVVFLSGGEGPYVLAVGHTKANATALPLASLLPDYQAGAEAALPSARVSDKAPTVADSTQPSVFGVDARTATLWGVLIGAVLILSAFALALMRKANVAKPNESTDR
jgi:hypothetical protein